MVSMEGSPRIAGQKPRAAVSIQVQKVNVGRTDNPCERAVKKSLVQAVKNRTKVQ